MEGLWIDKYIEVINNLMFLYNYDETFIELFLPFLAGGPLFNEPLMINTFGCEIAGLSSRQSK